MYSYFLSLLIVILLTLCSARGAELAEDFEIETTDGDTWSLGDFRGKVVLMMFMSSRCAACKALSVEQLTPLHADDSLRDELEIVSISVQDTMSSLQAYYKRAEYTWTHALDRASLIVKYRAFAVPTIVIVDRNGYVYSSSTGAMAAGDLRERALRAIGSTNVGDNVGDNGVNYDNDEESDLKNDEIAANDDESTSNGRDLDAAADNDISEADEVAALALRRAREEKQEGRRAMEGVEFDAHRRRVAAADTDLVADESHEKAGRPIVVETNDEKIVLLPKTGNRDASENRRDDDFGGGRARGKRAQQRRSSLWELFSFAAGAGFLSFLSPCSFALLPGYASYFLDRQYSAWQVTLLSLSGSGGILLVYCICAVLLMSVSMVAGAHERWMAVMGALVTALLGITMIIDREFNFLIVLQPLKRCLHAFIRLVWGGRPIKLEEDLDQNFDAIDPQQTSNRIELIALFWFGIAYGCSSAGCSTPVFIALLTLSIERALLDMLSVFFVYGLSVAACLLLFTLAIVLFRSRLLRRMNIRTQGLRRIGGVVLVLLGANTLWAQWK